MPYVSKIRSTCSAVVMVLLATLLCAVTKARAQGLPPLETHLNPSETALILVDFQYPFTNPAGDSYGVLKTEIEGGMLDRTVKLVKKARELGVWVIHVTEGYTSDYRELDPTNPGGFHRFGILGQAFKTGTPKAASYPPLDSGPNDKDLFLAPRIQTSGFGGTGLNEILRSRGIKNIAVAGFTTDVCDYATVTNGYDLGYHVYALKESMAGYTKPLSEMMLNTVYSLWSRVLSNDDFIAMMSADKEVSR
ncbi:MAG TPA: cysteine hydrolase [bacterium]|nr:cysteine hydrolase [bacterium]